MSAEEEILSTKPHTKGHSLSGTKETWAAAFALSPITPLPTIGASPGDPRSAEWRGLETAAERNQFATKAVGIRGRSRPTLQHARAILGESPSAEQGRATPMNKALRSGAGSVRWKYFSEANPEAPI
jgi:hypothetical protein